MGGIGLGSASKSSEFLAMISHNNSNDYLLNDLSGVQNESGVSAGHLSSLFGDSIISSMDVTANDENENDQASESLTGGVGTAMYRAPEQEGRGRTSNINLINVGSTLKSNRQRLYDSKVDMFSLGIILFEMCHEVLSTGMERHEILVNLRTKQVIPDSLLNRVSPKLIDIIKWLVNIDPNSRPTATDLQLSNLLPPRIDIDRNYLEEIMNALCIPNSDSSNAIISALFSNNRSTSLSRYQEYDEMYEKEIIAHTLKLLYFDMFPSSSKHNKYNNGHDFSQITLQAKTKTDLKRPNSISEGMVNKKSLIPISPLHLHHIVDSVLQNVFTNYGAIQFSLSLLKPRDFSVISNASSNSNILSNDIITSNPNSVYSIIHMNNSHWHTLRGVNAINDKKSNSNSQSKKDLLSKIEYVSQHLHHVEMLNKKGVIVTLPNELVTPYASYVARANITNATRYTMEKVYHEESFVHHRSSKKEGKSEENSSSFHPIESLEAVYDVIRETGSLNIGSSNTHYHGRSTNEISSDKIPIPSRMSQPNISPKFGDQTSLYHDNILLETCKRSYVECDVLSAAINLVHSVDPKRVLGFKALRLGDARLATTIFDLCGVHVQTRVKILQLFTSITDEIVAVHMKLNASNHSTSSIITVNNSAITNQNVSSTSSNSSTLNELNVIIKSLFNYAVEQCQIFGLSTDTIKALKPFIKVITTQINPLSTMLFLHKVNTS